MTREELRKYLEYEITGSWWAPLMIFEWMQKLASRYYAAKVIRKLLRAEKHKKKKEELIDYLTRETYEKKAL